MKPELRPISYNGLIIKPSRGAYSCPYKCGAGSKYPAPKWKTEKGLMKHLSQCCMRPEAVRQRDDQQKRDGIIAAQKAELFQRKQSEMLEICNYSLGQKVCYIATTIVKPRYEQRGGRMVKVRYEDVLRFDGAVAVIKRIGWTGQTYIFNGEMYESDLFKTIEEADKEAKRRTEGDAMRRTIAEECR